MTGMRRKAQRRADERRRTRDGLPRDASAWTVDDWRDLWRAVERARRRIVRRHRGSEEQQ